MLLIYVIFIIQPIQSSLLIQASFDIDNNLIIYQNKIYIESTMLNSKYSKNSNSVLDNTKKLILDLPQLQDVNPENSNNIAMDFDPKPEKIKPKKIQKSLEVANEEEIASGGSFWFYIIVSLSK